MAVWQLEILGGAVLRRDGRTVTPDRRSAALLAYLSLEGPTPRSRLAGLLWPDSPESTARNNLSQSLHRLRQLLGDAVVEGDTLLRLVPGVVVDAAELKTHAFSGDFARALTLPGELLGDLDFDGLPEFADWLYGEREGLLELRRQALSAQFERAERAGRFDEAAGHARRLVELDPVAETGHRLLMRALYLAGDRPAALRAYRQCRAVLARELGVEPSSETAELARRIERSEVGLPAAVQAEPELPIEVLRPPELIGRKAAWAEMEAAWERGQFIVLAGEPGVGKSRLMLDFAASKGRSLFLDGRPGDRVAPLATSTRNFRRIFEHAPDLELEPWVRRALSQVLPELAPDGPAPEGGSSRLLLEAVLRLMGSDLGVASFVYDDLQFADDASIDTGFYLISTSFPMGRPDGIPRWLASLRPDELSDHTRDVLRRLVAAGQAVWIELEPFDMADTAALVGSLHLTALDGDRVATVARSLHRRTGGNALFLLETLRHLIETHQLETLPEQLPVAGKVGTLVRQRLARLSPQAQRVAQAAAVLQSDFDLELVGRVLNADPLSLLDAWQELDHAQLFRDDRFSHDLLAESALAAISQPVRVLLNRRAAEVLEASGANSGRIAKHFLVAGERGRAGRALLESGRVAALAGLEHDADACFRQAFDLLGETGDATGAFEALHRRCLLLLDTDPSVPLHLEAERLLDLAVTPEQVARAAEVHARLQQRQNRGGGAVQALPGPED